MQDYNERCIQQGLDHSMLIHHMMASSGRLTEPHVMTSSGSNNNNNNNNNNDDDTDHQQLFVLDYYQAECSKMAISTDLRFKDVLIQCSQNGTLARQEIGSMIPIAALQATGYFNHCHRPTTTTTDSHPLMTNTPTSTFCLLDMCASPGSKTLQALETLLVQQQQQPSSSSIQKFMIVANDVLPSRLDATGCTSIGYTFAWCC
jgi:hypothetical protein